MFVVFGATGRVGGAAAAELRRRGLAVRAVTRDRQRGQTIALAGCEVAEADLYDESSVRRAMSGAKGVLLLCPLRASAENLTTDARALIEAAAAAVAWANPSAVVAISDYGAEHPSGTGIPTIYHRFETRLREASASATFLRSAEHMENWTRYLPSARSHGVLRSMHHPVTKLFPVVSAHDVGIEAARILANGMRSSAAGPPCVVHVEGPCRYSGLDVAATFAALLSRPISIEELPRAAWAKRLVAAGLGESYAQLVVELQDAHNAGRIDVENGAGELRRCQTTLSEALAGALTQQALNAPARNRR